MSPKPKWDYGLSRLNHSTPLSRMCRFRFALWIDPNSTTSTLCAIGISSISAAICERSLHVSESPNRAMSKSEVTLFVPVAREPKITARSTRLCAEITLIMASRYFSLITWVNGVLFQTKMSSSVSTLDDIYAL